MPQRETQLRRTPLRRTTPLRPPAKRPKRTPISTASPEQRQKVKGQPSIVSGAQPCDPAHLASRALGGCGSEDCVVPLLRIEHRSFDDGNLDLLPSLEPHHRTELAHCVLHLGLIGTLERVTGQRWRPVGS